jgi:hypothetical protein
MSIVKGTPPIQSQGSEIFICLAHRCEHSKDINIKIKIKCEDFYPEVIVIC